MWHYSSRLTSKVSTSKVLMSGGPRSVDTGVPILESKSLPWRGPGPSGTYRNLCLTTPSQGSQSRYFLVFLVAPIMAIESLVSWLTGVVMVEMVAPMSRIKSTWRPLMSILTMGSWGPFKRDPGCPQTCLPRLCLSLGSRLPWIWWQPLSFPFFSVRALIFPLSLRLTVGTLIFSQRVSPFPLFGASLPASSFYRKICHSWSLLGF
jgi:hypothetical protein